MLPASSAFASAYYGVLWAGRVPVPVSMLLPPPELARVLKDADVDRLITTRVFEPLVAALPITHVWVEDVIHQAMIAGDTAAPPPPPQSAADDVATILYTSGSSGAPKGVCLTNANLMTNATACIEHARMSAEQIFLGILPPSHAFGLTAMVIVPTVLGATVAYLPRFQPNQVMETIRNEHVSVFMAVPSMYAALLRMRDVTAEDWKSVVLAISGGEPLPVNIAAGFEQRFGKKLFEGYGLTETSPVVSLNVPWAYRSGSVGQLLPGLDGKTINASGHDLPKGDEGELLIRGHCVMQEYRNQPQQTADAIDGGGWFHTGDVAHFDKDGYLYITGRVKDVIIVGGDNVYPKEVENVLVQHPAVAEAAAVGVPDASRGEVVIAFITLRDGANVSENELRDFARQHLAGYKVPREVHILPELPRGPTGKVLKRQLTGTRG